MAIRHVWEKFNRASTKVVTTNTWPTTKSAGNGANPTYIRYSTTATITEGDSCYLQLTGTIKTATVNQGGSATIPSGNYFFTDFGATRTQQLIGNATQLCGKTSANVTFTSKLGTSYYALYPNTSTMYYWTDTKYTKGTTSYGNVTSTSSSTYPKDGYSGSYWYVYKGTESVQNAAVDGVIKDAKVVVCVNGVVKTNVSTAQGVNGVVKTG